MQGDINYRLGKQARKSVNDSRKSIKFEEEETPSPLSSSKQPSLKERFNQQAWKVLRQKKEERLSERQRLKSVSQDLRC